MRSEITLTSYSEAVYRVYRQWIINSKISVILKKKKTRKNNNLGMISGEYSEGQLMLLQRI